MTVDAFADDVELSRSGSADRGGEAVGQPGDLRHAVGKDAEADDAAEVADVAVVEDEISGRRVRVRQSWSRTLMAVRSSIAR